MAKKQTLKKPVIELEDDFFGAVLNCAVRYSIGRRSYMPGLVIDFISPLLPYLTQKTLWCFDRDLEGEENLGDPVIDAPKWKQFHEQVKAEIERRKQDEAAKT